MKYFSLLLFVAVIAAACTTTEKDEIEMPYTSTDFETEINEKPTKLFTLRNDKGMVVSLTNYGAKIVSVYAADKNGKFEDVVLGFSSIADYQKYGASHGAGRPPCVFFRP